MTIKSASDTAIFRADDVQVPAPTLVAGDIVQSSGAMVINCNISTMGTVKNLAMVDIMAMVQNLGVNHLSILLIQEPRRERGGSPGRSL